MGVHYRSSVDIELEGDSFLGPAFTPLTGGAQDFDGSVDVELPATAEVSLLYRATDKLDLHADIFWTNWDQVKRLSPRVSGTFADSLVDSQLAIDLDWENTFRYAVGATYRHSDKITLRTGVAFDESPVSDSDRTLRIPDRDRIVVSAGASYQFSESYRLDFGYSHIFAEDVPINDNETFFDGDVEGNANIFALSISGQL